jgi:hypothetical protein
MRLVTVSHPFLRASRRCQATTRWLCAVASPARTRPTICAVEKPCARKIASLQPSGEAASNSRARRRLALGPWRRWRSGGMEQQWRCLVGALRISGFGGRSRLHGHALDCTIGKLRLGRRCTALRGGDHQASKRGVIGESEHAQWCHLLWKSVCFSMCAGSAYCRKRLLVSPFGKKLCDINKRHNPF